MHTRRTVLKAAALSIIGSTLPGSVIAGTMALAPVKIVYEDEITESVAFKDALKSSAFSCHILKQDPAETFHELSGASQGDTPILGCTKGAAAFVLGELARGRGGKMLIYAEHQYLPGKKVQHTLQLPAVNVEEPADNWSSVMATALGVGIHHAMGRKKRVVTTNMSRPATSPDYLVTWSIRGLQRTSIA